MHGRKKMRMQGKVIRRIEENGNDNREITMEEDKEE